MLIWKQHLPFQFRRGSVLILVVVMVVLLALLGTALLSTSRGDRYTSTQHVANTQIDLLVEGVKDLAKAQIAASLTGSEGFRPALDSKTALTANSFADFDGLKLTPITIFDQGRNWLSARAPSNFPVGNQQAVFWPAIGAPLAGGNAFESPIVFDEPAAPPASPPPQTTRLEYTVTGPSPVLSPKFENRVSTLQTPEFMPVGINYGGATYPGFRLRGRINNATNANYGIYLAGDADGDGIADSGFFRLPVGTLDGVTYYAAVRIVDSASGVNISTAGSRAYDRMPDPSPVAAGPGSPSAAIPTAAALGVFADNLGWFHSHVGLQESLNRQNRLPANAQRVAYTDLADHVNDTNPQAEMLSVDRFRLGYDTSNNGLTRDDITGGSTINVDDSYAPTDITPPYTTINGQRPYNAAVATYLTAGDVLEHTLAKRLRNPGLNQLSTGGAPVTARAFSLSDAAALAYHNGTMLNTDAGLSTVDAVFYNARNLDATLTNSVLTDSVYSSVGNYTQNAAHPMIPSGQMTGRKAYGPGQVDKWFDDNYYADAPNPGSPAVFCNNGATPLSDGAKYRTMRPFLTTWNPVGKLAPKKAFDNVYVTATDPAVDTPAYSNWPILLPSINPPRPTFSKTSINTATFQQLWTAFQNVMSEADFGANPYISNTPFDTAAPVIPPDRATLYQGSGFTQVGGGPGPVIDASDPGSNNNERMFRSSLRDGASTGVAPLCFPPKSMVALRAAIAATQTEQLRINSTAAPAQIVRQFKLQATAGGAAGAQPILNVTTYGQQPQPFITEVFVSCDYTTPDPAGAGANNPRGYVCIELYNPFPTRIELNDYDMIVVDRYEGAAGSTYRPLVAGGAVVPAAQQVASPFAGIGIDPYQYVIIDNLGSGPDGATYRPAAAGPAIANTLRAPLQMAIGDYRAYPAVPPIDQSKELVLRRLVIPPADLATVTPAQRHAVYQPVDSFDFYDIGLEAQVTTFDYHYNRPTGQANNWKCVYPGRYFAPEGQILNREHRQQGTDRSAPYDTRPASAAPSPWAGGISTATPGHNDVAFGMPKPTPSYTLGAGAPPTIQMINNAPNSGQPGPNPLTVAPTRFPYGCFAREGDMLQVPFIGAYVVQDPVTGDVIEMNSISVDAAFAEDTDVIDDPQQATLSEPHEQIGHFCPIYDTTNPGTINRDDLSPPTLANSSYDRATAVNLWSYRWATKLFTYLTVHNSQSDHLPDFDPALVGPGPNTPTIIDNDGDTFANGSVNPATGYNAEDLDPNQGVINLNTAPWRVLATLPMMQTGNNYTYTAGTETWAPGPDPSGLDDNAKLAKAIVLWRDGSPTIPANTNGPFRTIFDLYRVPAFKNAQIALLAVANAANGPQAEQGDFSIGDLARNDYEEQYFLLNRISNLVTTRSDSFLVYVLVQGWRGIGDVNYSSPQLVVQRRAAFIQDRYGVYRQSEPLNSAINIVNE